MGNPDDSGLIRIARDGGGETGVEPLNLGQRVRNLRKARGWTLEHAALQAGLARSTLSKNGNGQMSPTYAALRKLAGGWRCRCRSCSRRPAMPGSQAAAR